MKICHFDLWSTVHTTSAERVSLVVSLVGVSMLLLAAILGLLYQSGAF
jgi:hypothetical protein